MHRFSFRVRYGDTDKMGVAYYGNYFRWFEMGRAEMLRSLRLTYREVEEGGTFLPVTEARCRYLLPAHCFLDGNGKPVRPPERLRQVLGAAPRAGAQHD